MHTNPQWEITRAHDLAFELAAHEKPGELGILKKVLCMRDALPPGRLQMVNWARLDPKVSSWPHQHEDLHEIFIVLEGTVEFQLPEGRETLSSGDAILIRPNVSHVLHNGGDFPAQLIVLGISENDARGKTVNLW